MSFFIFSPVFLQSFFRACLEKPPGVNDRAVCTTMEGTSASTAGNYASLAKTI
jgi:hypothetical protein